MRKLSQRKINPNIGKIKVLCYALVCNDTILGRQSTLNFTNKDFLQVIQLFMYFLVVQALHFPQIYMTYMSLTFVN